MALFVANNDYANQKLIAAIKSGCLRSVISAWAQGAECDCVEMNGKPALWYALQYYSDFEIIKFLVEHGANVNSEFNGTTCLIYAMNCTFVTGRVLEYLIDKGAEVNVSDCYRDTPLMLAASKGLEVIVNKLLDAGARLEPKNILGETVVEKVRSINHYNPSPHLEEILHILISAEEEQLEEQLSNKENQSLGVITSLERGRGQGQGQECQIVFMSKEDLMSNLDKQKKDFVNNFVKVCSKFNPIKQVVARVKEKELLLLVDTDLVYMDFIVQELSELRKEERCTYIIKSLGIRVIVPKEFSLKKNDVLLLGADIRC